MAEISEKKRLMAFLLCFFLGGLGVHRFYVGKVGTGIAQILTLGGLGVWAFIDLIMILCGIFKDKNGKAVIQWTGGNEKTVPCTIPGTIPGTILSTSPVENKPDEARLPLSPNQAVLLERWQLIITVSAVVAVVIILAVIVFQTVEFQYYRQPPSAWPSVTHAK